MKRGDKTDMGSPIEEFPPTHWSEIARVRTEDPERRRQILDEILSRYWKPVYVYLRRKGYDHHDAMDLMQGFFEAKVLRRELIRKADRAKGRFRAFLLKSLKRYAASVTRAKRALKRSPPGGLRSLDDTGVAAFYEPSDTATPDEAFTHAWASELLGQVLAEVEKSCRDAGKAIHWEVFRARALLPIMENAEPRPLSELCAKHGISSEARVSNMIVTVKRRFQKVLKRRVRESVSSDEEVDGEIRDLMQSLSESSARC
jgi:RNA polymerase sigma-70 factor (ECF subfamily)